MTTHFRAPWLRIVSSLLLGLSPFKQEGQKALVYCPVDSDASGCTAIVKALSDGSDFTGGVDRGYNGAGGTVDLRTVDLSAYSVIVVPSLADDGTDHPFAVLRDPAVSGRLRAALKGRQAVFSGTPDQGASPDTRPQKDVLIRNLAHWAAATYTSAHGPGLVALQDQSDDPAVRYAWMPDVAGYHLGMRTTPATYASVQALTDAGRDILANGGALLAYPNIASFGLVISDPSSALARAAVGQGGDQDLVLATLDPTTNPTGRTSFGFIAPLGSATADPSTFDATVNPVVEICAWTNNACVGAPVARFKIGPTGTDLPLTVAAAAGRYEASWNLLNTAFTTRKTYRIQVLKGADQLGFVLVDVIRGRWALTRADGSLAPLNSANSLPIWFTTSTTVTQNQPPVAAIAAPLDGATFAVGAPIAFTGSGTDPEDGALTGTSLVWTSSIAGDIGTGTSINVSSLGAGTHTITLTATDSRGARSAAAITVHVIANTPPTASIASPTAGSVVNAGQPIAFSGSGNDTEDGSLTGASLVWTDGAAQIGTGASVTMSTLSAGTHHITLTATDSKGLTGVATVDVIVNALPVATITSPANNSSFLNGQTIAFTGTGIDAEDGPLGNASLSWSSEAGALGTGAAINVNSLAAGTHTITLTVTDSRGAVNRASITVTVAQNQAPVARITSPSAIVVINAGQTIDLTGLGSDAEDGNLSGSSLVWSSSIAGPLGTGNGITVSLSVGDHLIALTATDSKGLAGVATVHVIVNAAPVAHIAQPLDGSSFNEGAPVTFTGSASDAEDGTLSGPSLVWTSDVQGTIGTGATFSMSTLHPGIHHIRLTASDSHGSTGVAAVTITIVGNRPPVATITAPSTGTVVNEGQSVTFTGTGVDPEDGALSGASLAWTSEAGALGTGASINVATLGTGSHTITLTVKDSRGATGTASITITIAANQPPTATITAPASNSVFQAGQPIVFSGSGTDPEDGALSGTSLVWTSDRSGQFGTGGSVTATLAAGSHRITLTATDSKGATATAQINIVITAPNLPPAVHVTAPAEGTVVPAGSSVSFAATAVDPEDGVLSGASVVWKDDAGTIIGTGLSITAPVPQGSHVFSVTATDTKAARVTATVTVIGNASPSASITSPANGATFADGATITFTGTGNDLEDGALSGASLTWASEAGALGSGASLNVNATLLGVGSHTITLTTKDSHGATGTASITIMIAANQPPAATINTPAPNSVFQSGQPIVFTGVGNDAEDGPLTGIALKWTSDRSGQFGTGTSAAATLIAGPHRITLTATDSRGASGATSIGIFVNTPPTVTITSPANGATFTQGTSIDFVASANDADEGALTGSSVVWTSDVAGALGTGDHLSVSTLGVGTHHITVAANDHQGGAATAQITIVVTAPNQPPVVHVVAPANGSVAPAGTPVTFTATAVDPEDGALTGAQVTWTNDVGATIGSGLTISVPVSQGSHVYTVTATDTKGLKGTATVTVIGNALPTVTITSPANNAAFDFGQDIDLRGNGADQEDGALTGSSLVWKDGATQLGTGPDVHVSTLAVGAHTITLTATDSRGAVATASVNITITANQPPSASITSPTAGAQIQPGQSVTFTGSATDPEDGPLSGASLVWSSSQDGVLGTGVSITKTLSGGPHRITLTATDSKGRSATATVDITVLRSTMSVPPTVSVPLGSTVSMPIQIIDPAPAGGLVVTVSSDNAGVVSVVNATVTIPAGQLTAGAQLQGVAPGTTVIHVSAPGYLPVTSQASVGGNLNIVQGSASFTADKFSDITIQLERSGTPFAAPPGGLSVTLTPTNPACVAVASPVLIPEGLVSATARLTYGGTATTPCTTTVTASVPSIPAITTDNMSVTVQTAAPPPAITFGTTTPITGAGLRGTSGTQYVLLGTPAPTGGVSLTLASSSPTTALVAINPVNPGQIPTTQASASSVTVTIPAGQSVAYFALDGLEGKVGTSTLSASAPGYSTGTLTATVRAAALELSLTSSTTSLSANSGMTGVLCYANSAGTDYEGCGLPIRPAGSPITVSFANSAPAVAQLAVIGGTTGQTVTTTIAVGQSQTPSSGTGQPQFDPLGAGTTSVSLSSTGLVSGPGATRTVTVSAPNLTFGTTAPITGSGLRATSGTMYVQLGAPAPTGGVDLTLSSANATTAVIAMNATNPGGIPTTQTSAASVTVTIPAGQSNAYFALDGLEGKTGTSTLTATAAGYNTGTATATVRPLALSLSLTSSTTSLSANSGMTGVLCYANSAGTDYESCGYPIRPAGAPITVSFTNSAAAVAQLTVIGGATAQTVTSTIAVGQSQTPSSGTGQPQFDPLGPGTTSVSLASTGLISGPGATRTVTVSAPNLTFGTTTLITGAGLRVTSGTMYVQLGAPAPTGGVDLTLASANGTTAVIAMNSTSPGSVPTTQASAPSVTVTVPAGQSTAYFALDGLEGKTGTSTLTATAAGYNTGTATATVRPLALLLSAPTTTTSLSVNSGLTGTVCYANSAGTDYESCGFPIRPAGTPITLTFTNSTAAVAQLTAVGGATAQTLTSTIAVGQSQTPSSGTGQIQFDPLGSGTTTVSLTSAGLISGTNAARTITVSAPALTFSTATMITGAGLRLSSGSQYVQLGAPAPAGGLDLTISSSNGTVAGIAMNTSSPGSLPTTQLSAPSVTVTVPAGQSIAYFALDGLEGKTGTVTLTASAAGYSNGTAAATVRPQAFYLSAPTTTTSTSANVGMVAQVCYANSAGTDYENCGLPIRPGGTAVTVTLTNSVAAVAQLSIVGGSTGQTLTSTIAIGSAQTPASGAGQLQFDPLSAGNTNVSALASGIISGPNAVRTIVVTP